MKKTIDIICPLYNAEEYIENLYKSLLIQKDVNVGKILFLLTESKDNSEQLLKNNKCNYEIIKKSEFSHSLTREKAAMNSNANIVCFITQDVVIKDDKWLYNLTKSIINGECAAAYSRQITKYNNIEKYTREKNYKDMSRMVSKKDIEKLGLNTFFFSDVSSAIKTSIFKKLNGYDGKNLPTNEDMYFAYKLIMNGYKIKYESKSVVYHSHNFTLKELYNRYKLTGIFFKQNSFLDKFNTTQAGGGMAKYVLKRALQEKNIKVIFRWLPDMTARYVGMKVGKYAKQ